MTDWYTVMCCVDGAMCVVIERFFCGNIIALSYWRSVCINTTGNYNNW